jgi:hypothetical protein
VSHYQAKRIDRLKDQLADERGTRQDQLRDMASKHAMAGAIAESRRIDAVQEAEKERVNALLAAQKADVALAAARAEGVASALADRVEVSAKTLATQNEATKATAQLAVDVTNANLGNRIKPLEDARYEQAGRRGGVGDISRVVYAIVGIIVGLAGPLILLFAGHIK